MTRIRLLSAIFAEAKKKGIDPEFLRDEVAPNICGVRLSQARPKDLMKLIEHLTGPSPLPSRAGGEGFKRYPSSRAGLLDELCDAARARWGEDWEQSLNAFLNSNRRIPTHCRFLRVADLKAIKERVKELNGKEGRVEAD